MPPKKRSILNEKNDRAKQQKTNDTRRVNQTEEQRAAVRVQNAQQHQVARQGLDPAQQAAVRVQNAQQHQVARQGLDPAQQAAIRAQDAQQHHDKGPISEDIELE